MGIRTSVSNAAQKTKAVFKGLSTKSPELLLVAGGVSVIAGTVFACRATLKAKDKLNEVDELHKAATEEPTKEYRKDVAKGYVDIVKLYLPSTGLMIAGFGCVAISHKQMETRLAGAIAAYDGLYLAFREYRDRVKNTYGEEADAHIIGGYHQETYEYIDSDTGEKTKIVCNTRDISSPSAYARYYDENVRGYMKNPYESAKFIMGVEKYVNDLLDIRETRLQYGFVLLSEVYQALGLPVSPESCVVGWVKRPDNAIGDGYITFNLKNPANALFLQGLENTCLLDFNVDGYIMNKLNKH